MKQLSLYTLFVTGIILTQAACNKELNALPDQAKVDANAIVDQKSAETALNGAYYRFANVGENNTTGLPSTQWSKIHEQYPSEMAGHIVYYQGVFELADNALLSSSGENVRVWGSCYDLVNAANGVIKGIEQLNTKIDPNRKKEMLAEARFLRAYGHYGLLSYFGEFYNSASTYGVMLRTGPVMVTNIAQKRNTVQETYDFILADVDDAIANAPAERPNYYATKWAAMALKMRILINRGAPGDYAAVITLADNIIQNSPYRLEANAKDIFKTKGLASTEIMLATKAYPDQISEKEAYFFRNNYNYHLTDSLVSYLKNDPRKNWIMKESGGKKVFVKYEGAQWEAKYAFRLTEVYLLKAEAIVRSGGSLAAAKTIVKEIMAHAGLTGFSAIDNASAPESLLVEIYKEITRSLVAEDGADWFALLRLPFEIVKQIKPSIKSKTQYIMPVPLAEHEKNPAFGEQNPGYGW
jgi:starch-binding outer membrane protein, SusD/RagB family